jgi:HD-GYP domain-containing protein (c-di-GMP phosphodiesterase class II)
LQRAIPMFLSEPHLRQIGGKPEDAALEAQILVLAEQYAARITRQRGAKMSSSQAGQEVIKRAGNHYDSLVLDGFTKIFGGQVAGASA